MVDASFTASTISSSTVSVSLSGFEAGSYQIHVTAPGYARYRLLPAIGDPPGTKIRKHHHNTAIEPINDYAGNGTHYYERAVGKKTQ